MRAAVVPTHRKLWLSQVDPVLLPVDPLDRTEAALLAPCVDVHPVPRCDVPQWYTVLCVHEGSIASDPSRASSLVVPLASLDDEVVEGALQQFSYFVWLPA